MIDEKTKAFLADIPHTVSDATTIFDLMLSCYLRGRMDEAKDDTGQSIGRYLRGCADAAVATGAAQATAQPNNPRLAIVPDVQPKPTTH